MWDENTLMKDDLIGSATFTVQVRELHAVLKRWPLQLQQVRSLSWLLHSDQLACNTAEVMAPFTLYDMVACNHQHRTAPVHALYATLSAR